MQSPKNKWYYNRFLDADVALTPQQQQAVEQRITELTMSRRWFTFIVLGMCIGVVAVGFYVVPFVLDALTVSDFVWLRGIGNNTPARVAIALLFTIGWVFCCLVLVSRMPTVALRQALSEIGHDICLECGYRLHDLDIATSARCPECGCERTVVDAVGGDTTKINLAEKLGLFHSTWSPKVVGALNGQLVKLAKLEGEFVWHAHADEDELFLVIDGSLTMLWRDADGTEHSTALAEGEMFIVPRGVEHNPVAGENGASVLLFEPAATKHTGEVIDERTQTELEWI